MQVIKSTCNTSWSWENSSKTLIKIREAHWTSMNFSWPLLVYWEKIWTKSSWNSFSWRLTLIQTALLNGMSLWTICFSRIKHFPLWSRSTLNTSSPTRSIHLLKTKESATQIWSLVSSPSSKRITRKIEAAAVLNRMVQQMPKNHLSLSLRARRRT